MIIDKIVKKAQPAKLRKNLARNASKITRRVKFVKNNVINV